MLLDPYSGPSAKPRVESPRFRLVSRALTSEIDVLDGHFGVVGDPGDHHSVPLPSHVAGREAIANIKGLSLVLKKEGL